MSGDWPKDLNLTTKMNNVGVSSRSRTYQKPLGYLKARVGLSVPLYCFTRVVASVEAL